jgi:hypothetical protein
MRACVCGDWDGQAVHQGPTLSKVSKTQCTTHPPDCSPKGAPAAPTRTSCGASTPSATTTRTCCSTGGLSRLGSGVLHLMGAWEAVFRMETSPPVLPPTRPHPHCGITELFQGPRRPHDHLLHGELQTGNPREPRDEPGHQWGQGRRAADALARPVRARVCNFMWLGGMVYLQLIFLSHFPTLIWHSLIRPPTHHPHKPPGSTTSSSRP